MKNFYKVLYISIIYFVLPKISLAVCPVCSVAVGAGVGLSRWLGVDDTISGLWIGALIVSMIIWTINWFNKRSIIFKFRNFLITLFYYSIIIIPLYYSKIIFFNINPFFLFFDKLTFGIILGSFIFMAISDLYLYLKKMNKGHAIFPFQKVVMPVGALILSSLILYLFTK